MLGQLLIILSTRPGLEPAGQQKRLASALHNRLRTICIGLLDSDEADQLVDRGHLCWEPGDKERLLHWCGRHSFFLELFGFHLFHARANNLNFDKALSRFIIDTNKLLSETIETCTPIEKRALDQLVSGKQVQVFSLQSRGLLTEDNRPFGHILIHWLENQSLL